MPRVTHHHFLAFAAVVCFVVALGIATGIIDSVRFDAWLSGGLLAWSLRSGLRDR